VRNLSGLDGLCLRGKLAYVEDCIFALFCGPCALQQVRAPPLPPPRLVEHITCTCSPPHPGDHLGMRRATACRQGLCEC
jgi:hypothetical protein